MTADTWRDDICLRHSQRPLFAAGDWKNEVDRKRVFLADKIFYPYADTTRNVPRRWHQPHQKKLYQPLTVLGNSRNASEAINS